LTIRDTDFDGNIASATSTSGSIVLMYAPVTSSLTNVHFDRNTARFSLLNNGISTVSNSVFVRNSGTLFNTGTLTVTDTAH